MNQTTYRVSLQRLDDSWLIYEDFSNFQTAVEVAEAVKTEKRYQCGYKAVAVFEVKEKLCLYI